MHTLLIYIVHRENIMLTFIYLFILRAVEELCECVCVEGVSQVTLVTKKLPANVEDTRDPGLIPGWARSLGGGHGSLLQYSCLENPRDTGAWPATVH